MSPDQAKQLEENTRMTRRMYEVIVGAAEYKQAGLIDTVKDQGERLATLERRFWTWGGIATGIALSWEAFKALLEHNSHK